MYATKRQDHVDDPCQKILYFAQIQSLLTYGLIIWGNMISNTDQRRLQELQDQGVQLIAPHMKLDNIYKEHKILRLKGLTQLENIKFWHKYHHNELSTKLTENMSTDHKRCSLEKKHPYNTRNKSTINLPSTNSKFYKTSFLSTGLQDYQLASAEIKTAANTRICTTLTKKHLLTGQ